MQEEREKERERMSAERCHFCSLLCLSPWRFFPLSALCLVCSSLHLSLPIIFSLTHNSVSSGVGRPNGRHWRMTNGYCSSRKTKYRFSLSLALLAVSFACLSALSASIFSIFSLSLSLYGWRFLALSSPELSALSLPLAALFLLLLLSLSLSL